jgi:hypothetical protein
MVGGEHAQSDPVSDKLEVSISISLVTFLCLFTLSPGASIYYFYHRDPPSCRVVSLSNDAMAAVDAYQFALMTE